MHSNKSFFGSVIAMWLIAIVLNIVALAAAVWIVVWVLRATGVIAS